MLAFAHLVIPSQARPTMIACMQAFSSKDIIWHLVATLQNSKVSLF